MRYQIHPNHKHCPLCGGDIVIDESIFMIYCELCTAEFTDPEWAEGEDDNHEVSFSRFEEESTAAEEMHKMYKDIAG